MEQYKKALEYILYDSFDMDDFDENPFEYDVDEPHEPQDEASEAADILLSIASGARKGKDRQGIRWERKNYGREKCREMRLKLYKNYENLSYSREQLEKECKQVEKGSNFYDFRFNTRLVKPTIGHFQLRNLLWATSKHDVYMMQNSSVMHWSSLLQRSREVLNVAGQIVPTETRRGSSPQSVSRVRMSTLSVKDNLMVAGGFQGELILKYLNQPGVAFSTKVTTDENAITNAVEIYRSSYGSTRVMAANNDCNVRIFDTENFALVDHFRFSRSVNGTSVSLDGKVVAVLGDSQDCLLADVQSGKVIGTLQGHLDYSFSLAWHPDGHILATGNQDTTCRLWDVRNTKESFAVLKGRMGAIRGIKFSSDGQFMAMAEPVDFVHIFDVGAAYCKSQEIDLFGEISGVAFSPDTEALFVGVAGRTCGSLLEFSRRPRYGYLDSFL